MEGSIYSGLGQDPWFRFYSPNPCPRGLPVPVMEKWHHISPVIQIVLSFTPLSNSELIKDRFESQFYSLPWTNHLSPRNFCVLSHIMLIGMASFLRVVMRIKWCIMLLHIKYLIKWYIYRVTTHMQEMLLNMDFSISAIFYLFHQSVQKFSLQICILSDLKDCTVAWKIQLNSLEPQAVPKARRMYFFKHVTTGNSDVVPRIRPRTFKKKKEKHHSCSRRWWKTEEHGDTKLMAVAHIFWWCQRTDKPTGQERHSWANLAATWMSCFLSVSLEGVLRGNLWRSNAWAQTNFCLVGATSQHCPPLTLPPSLSISS